MIQGKSTSALVLTAFFIATIFANCSSTTQLAESCIQKGKVYRSLGSLKRNFVDVDSSWLPRLIAVSEALGDKWIRESAESDSLEVRVVDWSLTSGDQFSYSFATQHRHILYPTFPKKSQVKLPCVIEVFFDNGFGKAFGQINIDLKIKNENFKSISGTWEWNKSASRIEFKESGSDTPTVYWDVRM